MKDDEGRGGLGRGREGGGGDIKTGRKRLLHHPINSSPEATELNSFRQSSALSRKTRSYAKATKQYPTLDRLIYRFSLNAAKPSRSARCTAINTLLAVTYKLLTTREKACGRMRVPAERDRSLAARRAELDARRAAKP